MLEYVPWHTMTPFNNVSSALAGEPCRRLNPFNRQRDECVQNLRQQPRIAEDDCCCSGRSLGDIMHADALRVACDVQHRIREEAMALACIGCKEATKTDRVCGSCDARYIADTPFPPDNCSLTFGAQTKLPATDRT